MLPRMKNFLLFSNLTKVQNGSYRYIHQMKKREVFLFASFVALFVLFAIFQNFSFPAKQLQQLTNKDFFETKIKKFIPSYAFKDYIGENIEAPYGYKEEIQRKIASEGEPIVFDHKKVLKDGAKNLPLYRDLRDLIETSYSENSSGEPCVDNPTDPQNNCFTEYEGPTEKAGSVKVRANPFRKTASIAVPGEVESYMEYDNDRRAVNVQFRKDLDKDAGLKVELDSEQQSGSINIDVRW